MKTRRTVALLVAVVALAAAAPLVAETVVLTRRPLPLDIGLELDYRTVQQNPRQDTFTSRVRVLSVDRGLRREPSRVRFQWQIFERERMKGQNEMGHITTTGIPAGRSYDPYWTNGQDLVSHHGHMWLSQRACEELTRTGETRFAISVTHRHDKEGVLRRVGEVGFDTRVDGQPVTLTALELKSDREDKLVVLADCANPLVLEANMPGIQQWKLSEARTERARRRSWR